MYRVGDWVRLTMQWLGKPRGTRAQVQSVVNEMYLKVVFQGDHCPRRVPVSRIEKISISKEEINPKQPYELIEELFEIIPAGTIVAFVAEVSDPDFVEVADTDNMRFIVPYNNLMKTDRTK